MLTTSFLPSGQAVTAAIQDLFHKDKGEYLYVSGSAIKFIMNNILPIVQNGQFKNVFVTLPALTGRDFGNASFLYQLNQFAAKIRISNKAIHTIILTSNFYMLISVASGSRIEDDQICGIITQDTVETATIYNYCKDIWDGGFPLHLGK